jgi:hypothetical protein
MLSMQTFPVQQTLPAFDRMHERELDRLDPSIPLTASEAMSDLLPIDAALARLCP